MHFPLTPEQTYQAIGIVIAFSFLLAWNHSMRVKRCEEEIAFYMLERDSERQERTWRLDRLIRMVRKTYKKCKDSDVVMALRRLESLGWAAPKSGTGDKSYDVWQFEEPTLVMDFR